MRCLVVKPHRLSATGFVGERLEGLGVELVDHVASEDGPPPSAVRFDAVLVMGAPWSVYGPTVEPWIGGVLDLLRESDERGVGVFGVCFGAQAMAAALGAEVRGAAAPELGWRSVETSDPASVPTGPWFMWHSDTFDLPEGARELARTPLGPQAFAIRRHLCVQFHPEAGMDVVVSWMDNDASDFLRAGMSPDEVLGETRRRERDARVRAAGLVDRFLAGAGVPSSP
ncbi:MAG: type 1 glutamine amidotransferase [Actinomycetota bacterium]